MPVRPVLLMVAWQNHCIIAVRCAVDVNFSKDSDIKEDVKERKFALSRSVSSARNAGGSSENKARFYPMRVDI